MAWILLLVGALAVVPGWALAAANNFSELAESIITLLNYASGVIIAAAVATYFYAIASDFKSILSGEMNQRNTNLFVWGVLGLFVMVSIWGILRIVSNSIFGL